MVPTKSTIITDTATMIDIFHLFNYEFMRLALLGGVAIAIITSLIGPFLVLRRLSLLGDGLAHVAFGGVALGFLLHFDPFIVSLICVIIGSLIVQRLIRNNIYGDAAIAVILSFGVGLGVLITGAVHGFTVDLFTFLIGSILTLTQSDIILILSILVIMIIFIAIFYKKIFFITFNDELAKLQQKDYAIVNFIFTIMVALAVAVSIRAVGILLVSALLVLPTLIALQVAKSFKSTIITAAICSIIAMIIGIFSSFQLDLPPSGMIVMILLALFTLLSMKPLANFIKQLF